MTIRKGQTWGEEAALSDGSPVTHDDRSLSRVLEQRLLPTMDAPEPVELGLLGGDLHRSVGAPRHTEDDLRAGRGMRLPIDVGVVEFDHRGQRVQHVFASHLVAQIGRGGFWAARTVIVMNGSFLGEANLGPRAHPNDGRLDVLDGKLPFGDRRQARKRMLTGSHVPHPSLVELRVKNLVISDDKEFRIQVDGEEVGWAKELSIRCAADAANIFV